MKTIGKGIKANRGNKSQKEQGIALTVMLVVLMFAATLSFGTLFLTQNNLKVAENIRNHAIAKYNAEAGIEVSHIMLNDDWKNNGVMPTANTAESMVPLAVSASGTEFNYYLDPGVFNSTNNNIYLAIIGKSGPDASYTTEMLAKAVPASTAQYLPMPIYTKGLVSKTTVNIKGMANTKLLNTGVHGNKGYDLKGNVKNVSTCTERNDAGLCLNFEAAPQKSDYFSGALGQSGYTCKAHNSAGLCDSGQPKNLVIDPFDPWTATGELAAPQPPVINTKAALLLGLYSKGAISGEDLQTLGYVSAAVDPTNIQLRDLADTNHDGAYNSDPNYGPVDSVINLTDAIDNICNSFGANSYNGSSMNSVSKLYGAGFRTGQVTCVDEDVEFPKNTLLKDMIVIVTDGDVDFKGDIDLENTALVQLDGEIDLGGGLIEDSIVYSSDDMTVHKNAEIKGVTSLLVGDEFTHNGRTTIAMNEDGPIIGLNVIAEGDIRFNGRSDTFGVYQTKGVYRQNGHSDLFGSVLAEKEILFNGGIEVDASMPISNPTMGAIEIVEEEAGFVVTGRR